MRSEWSENRPGAGAWVVTDGGELDVGGVGHEEVSVEVGGAHARGRAHAHDGVVRRGPRQRAPHVPHQPRAVQLRLDRRFMSIRSHFTSHIHHYRLSFTSILFVAQNLDHAKP